MPSVERRAGTGRLLLERRVARDDRGIVMGIRKTLLRLSIVGVCVIAGLLSAVVPSMGAAKAAASPSQNATTAGWKIVPTDASRNVTAPDGCAYVRANLAKEADLGLKRVACVTSFNAVTAAALPTLCHARAEHYTRFADCIYSEWVDLIIDTKTGKVLGTVTGATILWNSLAYNSRSWQEHIQLRIGTITGDGASTTVTAPVECPTTSTSCTPTGQGFWAGEGQYLSVKDGDVYNGELGWKSSGTSTDTLSIRVAMVFFNPAATNQYASLTVGPTEEIRCDSLTVFKPTKGGCVYLHYTENFFTVSTADKTVTAAAKFMAAAQKKIHNHAGWYGHGGALTRLSNAKTIAKTEEWPVRMFILHQARAAMSTRSRAPTRARLRSRRTIGTALPSVPRRTPRSEVT
jgi:hypothetical protein